MAGSWGVRLVSRDTRDAIFFFLGAGTVILGNLISWFFI